MNEIGGNQDTKLTLKERLKRILTPIGYILTIISFIYIVIILKDSNLNIAKIGNPIVLVIRMVVLGILSSIFTFMLAYEWKLILEFINESKVNMYDAITVYCRSNIAKYLPGNVLHLVMRNYMGNQLGWGNAQIAFSSVIELIFGLGMSAVNISIFILLGFTHIPQNVTFRPDIAKIILYSVGACGMLFAFVLIVFGYRYAVKRQGVFDSLKYLKNTMQKFFSFRFARLVLQILFISLICFILNGLLFFGICNSMLGMKISSNDFFSITTILSIAGFSGIITPGVPGGIGVKESVTVVLASLYGYSKSDIFIATIIFRIIFILADVFPFVISLILNRVLLKTRNK
ncbi:MAG: flippase-like domain-containing protein [Spirochaetes bacterium]|nr:flippase-like domain-containing protein [Spirochaetota bacterium]